MRLSILLLALSASVTTAQPPSSYAEIRFAGETPVEVVVDRRVRLVAEGRTRPIPDSVGASAYAGASEGGVLVALVDRGVRTVFAPVTDGRLGAPSAPAPIERPLRAGHTPVGAAVAPTPEGFAIFWQEASDRDPSAAYRTFLQRLGPSGEPRGEPAAVQAVWPLAAAAYLPASDEFYFLLFYGGSDPRQTRLCGVHIDRATLRPREHPWWASRPGTIDEGQLFVHGERVWALYRGGAEGDELLQVDVTRGGWGQQPAAPTRRARLGPTGVFGGRLDREAIRIVTRPRPTR